MKLLSVNKISYEYNADSPIANRALNDISFEIGQGEFVALIGHTGSGKSTLIEHLNGLLKPNQGEILFKGENIWSEGFSLKELRRKVALVFQYPDHQLFEETIIKDVMFGPKNKGLSVEEQREKAARALKLTGIPEDMFEHSPFELSGGQKRRVAIAGALAMEPEILVLDEPTAGLDPAGKNEILDQVRHLQKELGLTVVLVSHSMEDIARYADRILVMDDGRLAFDGKPELFFEKTKDIERMGLKAPETVYVLKELRNQGFMVDTKKIKISDAVDEIITALGR